MAKKKRVRKSRPLDGFKRTRINYLVEKDGRFFVFVGVPALLDGLSGDISLSDQTLDKMKDFAKAPTALPDFQVGGYNFKTLSATKKRP